MALPSQLAVKGKGCVLSRQQDVIGGDNIQTLALVIRAVVSSRVLVMSQGLLTIQGSVMVQGSVMSQALFIVQGSVSKTAAVNSQAVGSSNGQQVPVCTAEFGWSGLV